MALHKFSSTELEKILSRVKGHTLGEVDAAGVFRRYEGKKKVTGIAGTVIEQSVLGYPADTDKAPDLLVDGEEVELKTTGVREYKKKKEYHAKEPVTITAVSIGKIEFENDFEDSSFWTKSRNILFVIYLYKSPVVVPASEYANFPILGHFRNVFTLHDRIILEKDWTLVRNKIREISALPDGQKDYGEIDTLRTQLMYIDTAPKWPNKPRFRLKMAFVDILIRVGLGDKIEAEGDFFPTIDEFHSRLISLSRQFKGQSMGAIAKKLGIDANVGKSLAEKITAAMFGGAGHKVNSLEVFAKAGVVVKTITLTEKGGRTEDMKLRAVDFSELMNASLPFEQSTLYTELYEKHILLVVFQEPEAKCKLEDNLFLGFCDMMLPLDDISKQAKQSFLEARNTILSGQLIDKIDYKKDGTPKINKKTGTIRSAPNLPKAETHNFFIRGSGTDSRYKTVEIKGVRMYYQNWWVKGSYIVSLLKKEKLT